MARLDPEEGLRALKDRGETSAIERWEVTHPTTSKIKNKITRTLPGDMLWLD